jgi:hypothetical protein
MRDSAKGWEVSAPLFIVSISSPGQMRPWVIMAESNGRAFRLSRGKGCSSREPIGFNRGQVGDFVVYSFLG